MAKEIPLKEISIKELFISGDKCSYEIPIYQRNYAWEKDEIQALIQDSYDAYQKNDKGFYYIGTLVTYNKGDGVFEVIDGQQRLTTIRLILSTFDNVNIQNPLTYRARKKSDDTIKHIPKFNIDEVDTGIVNGYKYTKAAINEIIPDKVMQQAFFQYFVTNVHIIQYQVPKDIDLNHYFEIMNSRGEQLEKHEIVKAKLMDQLDKEDERQLFNRIWECCAEMNVYIQQNLNKTSIFSDKLNKFIPTSFDEIIANSSLKKDEQTNAKNDFLSINQILSLGQANYNDFEVNGDSKESFQPVIDFSNFLLIVLKLTRMDEEGFNPLEFNLDDKELLSEFNKSNIDPKNFAFKLLKARFLLDNYIVHHSREDDSIDNNPWKLQIWQKDINESGKNKSYPKNLVTNADSSDAEYKQNKLIHLLSMFEVSFTQKQRKNYLFYCLFYLIKSSTFELDKYIDFVENLAGRYFYEVYLDSKKLNSINTPIPGSFDETILNQNALVSTPVKKVDKLVFNSIYGDGLVASRGIPLFVFNYLDYKLWDYYANVLRGEKSKKGSTIRNQFFNLLGCSDFELDLFKQFYFSRTRRSLEHYYPQAKAIGENGALNQNQINCFGNYAMIGAEANSSGSNWDPLTKLTHYVNDHSGKINQISVASLKFAVMMQSCKDNQRWEFEDIIKHQNAMIDVMWR